VGCLDEAFVCRILDGSLPEEERVLALGHLDACESCRHLVGEAARRVESTAAETSVRPRGGAGPTPLSRGSQVGRYLVLETIGAGGMGVVYAAYDPNLDRRIALKLLLSDTPSGAGASDRLLREAQAMARLAHPNVVTVHDVGTVGEEVFVAMEHVEGKTLASWIRERKRAWPEVLAAFRMAGAGLAAAHAAGIIHRDFKPDNVLVGRDGRIRVTDFGLARTDVTSEGSPDLSASTPTPPPAPRLTLHGHVIGTPAYMAPEQADGVTSDARSDLFSFCVALYEALYGERPFPGYTIRELRNAARSGAVREPPRGSKVPPWIRQVLLRGLANDPAERFPSMTALLAALGRDPARRRRRWAWAGVLLVAAAGAAALTAWAMEARALTCSGAERKLAGAWDDERKREVHAAFLATGRPFAPDTWNATRQTLDEYARRWVSMHTEACEATRVHGDQSEELLDLRVQCLMVRRGELAELSAVFAKADGRVVENAVNAARRLTSVESCADLAALRSGAALTADEPTRARAEEARTRLAIAKALLNGGKPREALEAAKAALAVAERAGFEPVIAEASYRIGLAQAEAGDFRAAEQNLSAAYWRALSGRNDEAAARAATWLLFIVGRKLRKQSEAHRWAQDARALLRRIGRNPRLEALFSTFHGVLERLEGRPEKAILDHRRALAVLEAAGDPDDLLRADCLGHLATAEFDLSQYESGIARLREVLAITERSLGRIHPRRAEALADLSRVLGSLGRTSEALEAARQALSIREQTLGPKHRDTTLSMADVALMLAVRGRLGEAAPMLRRALTRFEELMGPEHPDTAYVRSLLGRAMSWMGRYEDARALFQQVLAVRERRLGKQHPLVLWTLFGLARALSASGRYAEAMAVVERAGDIHRAQSAPDEHSEAERSRLRGEAEAGLGRYREALQSYARALSLSKRLFGPSHLNVGQALLGSGEALAGLGRFADAVSNLQEVLGMLERTEARPWLAARARFALARSLFGATKDRRRALALAGQARTEWTRLVPADGIFPARIDAWLALVRGHGHEILPGVSRRGR
jgi:tetratricopeptide (TPR) repeat protein